jgi:RecB family exonuclease
VEIVDYKTGKHDSRFVDEPLFQLQIYAAAIEKFMGYKVKKVKLIYVRPDQHHIEEKIIKRSDINQTTQKFNKIWRDIKNNARDGKFPCKTGPLCNWCDAQTYCPAWEGATATQRSRRWGPFGTHPNANPNLGRCSDHLPSALSPSSALDYLQCPRKFYESKISGRIVFQATEATTKGNLAHHAFEKIFDLPKSQRTPAKAVSFIRPHWKKIRHTEEQEDVNNLPSSDITRMLRETDETVKNWFRMENPKEINPIETEIKVEGTLGRTPMRGIIDRIDISET